MYKILVADISNYSLNNISFAEPEDFCKKNAIETIFLFDTSCYQIAFHDFALETIRRELPTAFQNPCAYYDCIVSIIHHILHQGIKGNIEIIIYSAGTDNASRNFTHAEFMRYLCFVSTHYSIRIYNYRDTINGNRSIIRALSNQNSMKCGFKKLGDMILELMRI